MPAKCPICRQTRREQKLLNGPGPGECCANQAHIAANQIRIPKLFTTRALVEQAKGLSTIVRAGIQNARGRTPYARKHGRVRAVLECFRFWTENWYVTQRKGWI